MAGILAIEADQKRQTLLKTLIHDHVQAEITMVDSVKAAIASFARCQPDVIVAPPLLWPGDSEQLISHVKQHAGPHVQIVTIPALAMLRDAPPEEKPRLGLFRRRGPISLGLQYDPGIVGKQIADRLERARTLRAEQKSLRDLPRVVKLETSLAVRPPEAAATAAVGAIPPDRRWARRTPHREVPWLWTVKLPWGAEVAVVNISRTGVLVESGSKVSPGVALELRLSGPGLDRVVTARFLRSDVARVDRLGVRYHAAAKFDEPLDILSARAEQTPCSAPLSLAALFTTVLSESNPRESAAIRFARGVRALIGARDVLVGRTPIAPAHDCESIYFHVKDEGGKRTILQVVFERDRAVTADEFRLLKAAASLTAGVLELEQLSTSQAQPAASRLSEVA